MLWLRQCTKWNVSMKKIYTTKSKTFKSKRFIRSNRKLRHMCINQDSVSSFPRPLSSSIIKDNLFKLNFLVLISTLIYKKIYNKCTSQFWKKDNCLGDKNKHGTTREIAATRLIGHLLACIESSLDTLEHVEF
jgi:hypothetical protein